MSDNTENNLIDQFGAFRRIWADTMLKMMQTAFSGPGSTPPPDMVRQMRSGIFQALAQSWEEFMRSPQFLEGMKQWMDQAIQFRKVTNDFMGKVRHEFQAPSRDDVDTIMLTVRHMEKRLLDRIEQLTAEIQTLKSSANGQPRRATAPKKTSRRKVRTP